MRAVVQGDAAAQADEGADAKSAACQRSDRRDRQRNVRKRESLAVPTELNRPLHPDVQMHVCVCARARACACACSRVCAG